MLAVTLAAPYLADSREDAAYPADSIVLFVAAWCAPCRAELARLDAIADAARPRTVWVMLVDDTRAGREMLRGVAADQRWRPDPAALRRIRAGVLDEVGGLPYSIVTDAHGRRCGERRDGLDPARTRAMIAGCPAR